VRRVELADHERRAALRGLTKVFSPLAPLCDQLPLPLVQGLEVVADA
jgi:hypothetical protein